MGLPEGDARGDAEAVAVSARPGLGPRRREESEEKSMAANSRNVSLVSNLGVKRYLRLSIKSGAFSK